MAKYGIENVRGGSYCNMTINDNELKILKKELDTALDRCFVCGSQNHLSMYCPNRGSNVDLSNKRRYNIPSIPNYLPPIPEESIENTDDLELFIIDKTPDYSLLEKEFVKNRTKPCYFRTSINQRS